MAAILRSLGRSATTAGLFGRRCRLLSEAASDHQVLTTSPWGVEASVWFRSTCDAERARSITNGRNIYDGCCLLDVQHKIAKNSGHMKKGSASAMMQQERDAAESGVQSIGGDDLAPSPRLLFWGRIIRLSIITYASFKLGQNSARNAYKRTKAELPCLEAVDSTTA
ncbi:Os07g0184633 [Oryza sativa Japonica Group]|uniref:Os07g0184633 protein n=1 Tax=Oryza sativa subsp. japonica TaxID=39947 RepID=C7J4X8_ORYSJ|nr:Os07g0184633 [Oryza sativa Japonica Group]|eukprot:NP_001175083.1 Os07g0184633 [Oryza sativa Japonica Group]